MATEDTAPQRIWNDPGEIVEVDDVPEWVTLLTPDLIAAWCAVHRAGKSNADGVDE